MPDLVCFSHLRWGFVYQRPNHLMARAARARRVFFVEEPIPDDGPLEARVRVEAGISIVQPVLPPEPDGVPALPAAARHRLLGAQMSRLFGRERIECPWLWFYTPLALPWTSHLPASAVVYDCMDELAAFRFAPARLVEFERQLLGRADVVFTGGRSLFDAKRPLHPRTHLFPSAVDTAHFGRARQRQPEPPDQACLGGPKIGYFGVIDERIDLTLLAAVARLRPEWQLVMLGPFAKLREEEVPRAANIHWLGMKRYDDLPAYLSGWDVALMPFALNEATRHISPTKTLEYLAGGRPVVSTPIADVVRPYGALGLVDIAAGATAFVAAIDRAMRADRAELARRADELLGRQSWDSTWREMEAIIGRHQRRRGEPLQCAHTTGS